MDPVSPGGSLQAIWAFRSVVLPKGGTGVHPQPHGALAANVLAHQFRGECSPGWEGNGYPSCRSLFSFSWLPQCPRWRGQLKKSLLIHVQGSVGQTTWLLSNHHHCHSRRHHLWHLYNLVVYQIATVYVIVLVEAQIPALMELGQI